MFAPGAAAQDTGSLQQRLITLTGEEYVAARQEALGLPPNERRELLGSLRSGPEHSLEQILAIILEARIAHPEVASRFESGVQTAREKQRPRSRSGRSVAGTYTSRDPQEVPFVYEELIKIKTPVGVACAEYSTDHVPFILYRAKHESVGAVAGLIAATESEPAVRATLRPVVVSLYKEARLAGRTDGIGGVYHMFRYFGTEEDLAIMTGLREFDRDLLPKQGVVLESREVVEAKWREARSRQRVAAEQLRDAEANGAEEGLIEKQRLAVEAAKREVAEADRRLHDAILWGGINDRVHQLEEDLARRDQSDSGDGDGR